MKDKEFEITHVSKKVCNYFGTATTMKLQSVNAIA